MEFQNLDDLKKLRVVDLKERLAKLGKSTSGLKADLVDRLYNALAEKAGQVDLSAAAPSYVQMCNMSSMEPEPPVVEVTIDTSQFDMTAQEPQIVTMGQYNVIENVPDMNAEMDQEQVYYQRQEESERLRQQQEELWRQQQQQREEQLLRQQEAERYHQQQQQEFQRQELERIQREEEEAERLRQIQEEEEIELRRQQEVMELRRQQEEMDLRLQREEEMALRRRQDEEEMALRRQQEEMDLRRQQEEEEMELRRQQEEEMRRRQQEEKELQERQEEERRLILEEEFRRRQEEEEYRLRQEEEMRRKYEEDMERQRKQELERRMEMERQRQIELERQRELELERQRELELERQRELELERQRELELERQRELEEMERQRQIEYERQEMERQRELELKRQRELEQIELERQKEIELLTLREMERQRELALEAEKRKELEREQERQRQLEAEEAEQRRLYELEQQRKAEEERMHALYEEEVRRERDEQMRQQEEFQRRQQEEALRRQEEENELRQSLIAESEANREKEMEEEYENETDHSTPSQQKVDSVVNSYSASVITHTGTPMDLSATRVVEPEPTDNGTEDSHSQESESGDADKSLETVNNEKNKENLVSETNQNEEIVSKRGPRQPKVKLTKSEKRKQKKKRRQQNRREHTQSRSSMNVDDEANESAEPDVEVQYVGDKVDLNPTDPMYHHFMKIFEAFKLTDPEQAKREAEEAAARAKLEAKKEPDLRKKPKDADEEPELEPKKDEQPKLSKRKLKQLTRLSIAELKQHVNRPDVVEMHDVTAKDPKLLVLLKSTRNTVPVPRHWCFKRKFLQGKRGIEKPPFNLPEFIKKTGIMEMRQALQEKEDQKTLKAKMREKVRPKMGKIDIDYQKLHDAFFKWQTKPRMTIHGDLYYEGKEYETRLKEKKPGELSDDLRTALGMPVGPGCQKIPPPWLIAMQRYGPPPSYPNLKIPGLNSPIPDSCSFGYHAGGWGKPPVDEMGRPLYGDVFGTTGSDYQQSLPEEEVDRSHWGELESESESESEPEEEEEEPGENEEDIDKEGLVTPADGGLATPSGLSSVSMGMETPDMIELRKRKIENEMETGENPSLYTILPEKKTDRLGGVMMGSTHVYDITAAMPAKVRTSASHGGDGGVDVALDPSELDMDTATMTARYEQTLREQRSQLEKEDLSDMVAEHTAKQKNKRKRAAGQEINRSGKKYKDFKF